MPTTDCQHDRELDVTAPIGGGDSTVLTTICAECGVDLPP